MMQMMMAASLLLLTVARVPALRRNGRDTVFVAAVFAGTGSLLASPPVYTAVDGALGGINLTKMLVNGAMIVGLWYLRLAVINAVSPEAGARSGWVRRLPVLVALALQTVFFILTGPLPTTTTWGDDYHGILAAALFSMVFILFIAWSCGEIAWACFQYVPQMSRSFRVGFVMVGLGSLISVAAMLQMALETMSDAVPALAGIGGAKNTPYHLIELAAIALVGIGLSIPAFAGRRSRRRLRTAQLATIEKITPIRDRMMLNANTERMLQADTDATPGARLHRMLVEIWDADLAAGEASQGLTAQERECLLSIDSTLALEPAR